MPINSHHLEYVTALPGWLRARDVVGGEDLVKRAGEKYLARLDGMTDDEYAAYLGRASYYNATGRTVEGYVGLMFRRSPVVWEAGPGVAYSAMVAAFLGDVDLLGTSLEAYARALSWEVLTTGRGCSLVDWEGTAEQRAYLTYYPAEQIVNWRVARVAGRSVLTLVVLAEVVDVGDDEFCPKLVEQWRVLRLVTGPTVGGAAASRRYVVELWRRDGQGAWFQHSTVTPLRRGLALPLIPFVWHGARHSRPDVGAVPLTDLIVLNLDHYRLNADYKHGLHFTALPTAWVSGFERGSVPKIGSTAVWVSEQIGATAGYLEFLGTGLGTFETAMDRDERMLSMLGTRLLESERKVAETATAIKLRQSGEQSVLATVANSISDSLTDLLRWVIWWGSAEVTPDEVMRGLALYQINTDFGAHGLASQDLQALVAAWQAGALSQDTMLELMRRGELLPEGRTTAEEQALIGQEAAAAVARRAAAVGAPVVVGAGGGGGIGGVGVGGN